MTLTPQTVVVCLLSLLTTAITNHTFAQNCDSLTASWSATASRCKATGTVAITVKGGSGNYNYMLAGPVSTGFTSSSSIGGLPGGTYTGSVKDIVSTCTFTINNIVVPGTYIEPRFGLTETDVSCANGNDGTIAVTGLTNGLGPFSFWVVAPSPMLVGGYSATGNFTGLIPGTYSMQLLDSCGDIQTRTISIQNYSWAVYTSSVVNAGCTNYNAQLTLRDSKGNFNTSGTAFTGFQYGVVAVAGDTTWFSTPAFPFDLGQNRHITLVAKDRCGAVQSINWSNPSVPSVGANLSITSPTCTGFNVSVMNPMNLTTPQYCLLDGGGSPVPGQPCNSTGTFTNVPYGSFCMQITNGCYDTTIMRCFTQTQAVPALTGAIALSAYTCTGVTATVTGQQNLTTPQYCVVDASGNAVPGQPCNGSGVFVNVPYGVYTVNVTDGCSATVLSIGFSSAKLVKSVASTVTISGGTCSSFNVAVPGATNLISPEYCILDSLGNTLTCNGNGVFNGLAYGSYCINIVDACGDTTIQRCFHQYQQPVSGGSASVTNKTCSGFNVTVTGQANVFNGNYCLLDSTGNPAVGIPCNSTGVFTNVPYGSYCIQTTDACSGTANTVCFSAVAPVPVVGAVTISNKTCAGFTATQTGQKNLTSPTYCLLDALGNTVGACNATGVFAVGAYGSYQLQTIDGCADSVLLVPFSVSRPIPSVNPTVNITNQNCTSFTATITGQAHFTNPYYALVDSLGDTVATNNTGMFAGVLYGSYCIDITDGCGDTTISRCFSTQPNPITIALTATPSCTYNATDVTVNVTSGFGPFTVVVYDVFGHLLADTTVLASSFVVAGVPKMINPLLRVVVTGTCGSPATAFVLAVPSQLTRSYLVVPQCPSSAVPSGSGDLDVTASSNLTPVNLQITQFNFSPVSISYSYNSGTNYTFSNLDAGTYVLTYSFSSCSSTISDTVVIPPYTFPGLDRSAAYQCNDNSFTISGAASNGISPFTYQIIGSVPAAPVVNSAAQASPLFSINTGAQYSLIRLRAIDACGNSALADVDILPLQNTLISASANCFNQGSTLSVNTIPNAVYGWYYKPSDTASDSTLVGTDTVYAISSVTAADTGVYVNRMSINSGCLTQLSYFHLDGSCNGMFLLPLSIVLNGQVDADGSNLLTWVGASDASVQQFIVERSSASGGGFVALGPVDVDVSSGGYLFHDESPLAGTNFYRLRVVRTSGNTTYSNVVALSVDGSSLAMSVFPNPVTTELNVAVTGTSVSRYRFSLYTATGQCVYSGGQTLSSGSVVIRRTTNMVPGFYLLRVDGDLAGSGRVFKVLLQ
jgi:hypothetical protein